MANSLRLPKFWLLATIQVILVLVGSMVWFYFRTTAYLAGPPDPDTYAWSWEFQLVTFVIIWLPAILLCTGIFLVVERIVLIPIYRISALQSEQEGR